MNNKKIMSSKFAIKISHAIKVLLALLLFSSCQNKSHKEYQALKNSKLEGQKLFLSINEFEKTHSDHFESKVDLAQYYFLTGDYAKSIEFIIRAESLVAKIPKTKDNKKLISLMYGTRAEIETVNGNYEKAIQYSKKAFNENKKDGLEWRYIEARALYISKKNTESLNLYDELYAKIPDKANKEDLRTYMQLLHDEKRFDDCISIIEKYLKTGAYFLGLGTFASTAYEKNNDLENSIFHAFLDYEYADCFENLDKNLFLKNLNTLENTFKESHDAINAINIIRKYVEKDFSSSTPIALQKESFISSYILTLAETQRGFYNETTLEKLLSLESYFLHFPSYYWNVYQSFVQVKNERRKDFIPLLEKIITLGNENKYIKKAKLELGKTLGLTEIQSQKLLTQSEIDLIFIQYQIKKDKTILEPLFSLLELPDNDYVFYALASLKNINKASDIENILQKKMHNATPRLLERIHYVLE